MIRLRPSGADEVLIKRVRDWYEPGPGVFIEPQSLFSPAMLFTGTTTGAWYDPSDINLTWRRNLLTYSEQFDDAAWFKNNWSVSTNSSVAPDGSMTADKMVENTVNGFHATYYTQSLGTVTGTYSYSVYLKNAGRSWANIRFNGVSTWFDITNGAIGTIGSGVTASISSAGNGWYRCTVSAVVMSVAISPEVIMTTGDLAGVYTGDGTSGIYVWGAQLEQGSTATPYQRITDGIQDYLQYQAQPVLYQDAAGTTPVTGVEQPVGLMLDKSKGLVLGSENVVSPYTGFVDGSWVISGTSVTRNGTATQPCSVSFGSPLSASKQYRVSFTVSDLSGDTFTVVIGGVNAGNITTNGQKSFILTGGGISIGFIPWNGTVGQVTITNISVRELPGNHAFNPSGNSANFPVLSARYNLLTKTEQFDDAVWLKNSGASVVSNILSASSTGTYQSIRQSIGAVTAGTSVTATVRAKAGTTNWLFFAVTDFLAHSSGLWVNLSTGQKGATESVGSDITAVSSTVTAALDGYFDITLTALVSVGKSNIFAPIELCDANNTHTATAGATIVLSHADLRVANDGMNLPAYQRVNTATDYDTVGFKPYLRFNGTNQWLQTNSIDFSYTDKMFVCAGVRKLSDAATGILLETSNAFDTTNGVISIAAPIAGAYKYGVTVRGTVASAAPTNDSQYASPITNVLSGISNISGDQAILRINGSQAAISTADQGTGNYGDYPLYIGARAGTSLWFNGRLYGMVVAGKQVSAVEIDKTETYLNQKTGAY